MQKSETLISYEGVKQSFEGNITISGGRFLGGVRVSLKALRIYLNGVRSKIEALPRVEIVRCKNCKWWNADPRYDGCSCWSADPYEYPLTDGDDYCSYGEPKDE